MKDLGVQGIERCTVELELSAEIRNTSSDGVLGHGVNRTIVRAGYFFLNFMLLRKNRWE